MNSRQLEQKYSDIYKNFYINNHLVISVPFTFNRTSGGEFFESAGIKGKVPLRMLLGLRKSNKQGINFGNILVHDVKNEKYQKHSIKKYINYFNKVKNYIVEKHGEMSSGGIEISILSEIDIAPGLNFEHILSIGLIILTKYRKGEISSDGINNLSTKSLRNNERPNVIICLKESAELINEINNQHSILSQVTSIINSEYPIICNNKGNNDSISSKLENIKELNEIVPGIKNSFGAPIDLVIGYSGIPQTKPESQENPDWAIEICNLFELSKNVLNEEHLNKDDYKKKINTIGDMVSKNALLALCKLFQHPETEEEISRFIYILGKSRFLNYLISIHGRSFNKAANIFIEGYFKHYGSMALIPHHKSLRGGCFLSVIEYNRSRTEINNRIQKMKDNFRGSYCIYKSREDEYDERGLIIEQDLNKGIIHPLIDNNLHVLRQPDGTYLVGSFLELLENPEIDVMFDVNDGKIYVAGEKSTSKEFFSQSAVVELMHHIIAQNRSSIMNTELPRSSFTKDKNTLNAKVINPLKKIIKEKTGKTMHLQSTGSLTEFEIIFEQGGVNLGLLKKIGD